MAAAGMPCSSQAVIAVTAPAPSENATIKPCWSANGCAKCHVRADEGRNGD